MRATGRLALAALLVWTATALVTAGAVERAFAVGAQSGQSAPGAPHARDERPPDVVFIPTPDEVVTAMLQMANVGRGDVVYDLGSGDGRIVIAAVKQFGAARGVGIEIDPVHVQEAIANARRAGVADRVTFRREDLFETDFSEATVVTLYLQPVLNRRLAPRLRSELAPGTRIVSHAFDMGDWQPEDTRTVSGRPIFKWIVRGR